MKIWWIAVVLSVVTLNVQAESLKFFRLNVTISMEDRSEMTREFVVQEKQISRINMAPEGEKKVILEVLPEAIGPNTRAVKMECKLEAEMTDGKLKVLGKPKFTTRSRSPASITVQSKDLPQFTLKVAIAEAEDAVLVESAIEKTQVHRHKKSKK